MGARVRLGDPRGLPAGDRGDQGGGSHPLNESGKVARTAQQAIFRSVDEMKFCQDQLLGKWEQVRHKAEDSAAALSAISFFIWLALLAVAFGIGLIVGRML